MSQLMVDPGEQTGKRADEPGGSDEAPSGHSRAAALSLQQLVIEHYQAVYRYAYRLTGSVEDAEDMCQQTFLVAQRKLYQVRDPEKADRWLFAVLRSCYLKGRRRQRPVSAASLELNVDEVPEEAVRQLERGDWDEERLQRALDGMPDDYKLIVLMFYFEDLSYKEIAEKLEIKMGTVMSRLSRAKGWLRRCLLAFDKGVNSEGTASRSRSSLTAPPSRPARA